MKRKLLGGFFIAFKCNQKKEELKIEAFLSSLVTEIELLAQLLAGKEKAKTEKPRQPYREMSAPDEIVAENLHMKELIKQAKRIADSDIFVLIQGESGTGKELFARLIHKNSRRNKKKFIAINCAAIPENLLESHFYHIDGIEMPLRMRNSILMATI